MILVHFFPYGFTRIKWRGILKKAQEKVIFPKCRRTL